MCINNNEYISTQFLTQELIKSIHFQKVNQYSLSSYPDYNKYNVHLNPTMGNDNLKSDSESLNSLQIHVCTVKILSYS